MSYNPIALLSNINLETLLAATPEVLKKALRRSRKYLSESVLPVVGPGIGSEVDSAFGQLEETLEIALNETGPEQNRALKQLDTWKESYSEFHDKQTHAVGVEPRVIINISDLGIEYSKVGPIVSDPTYLTDMKYMSEMERVNQLPSGQKDKFDVCVQRMRMYSGTPERESLEGIGKEIFAAVVYGKLVGIDFLKAYQGHITSILTTLVYASLSGRQNGASWIAELGIPLEEKEQLFRERVEIAERSVMALKGSLEGNFPDDLHSAVRRYVNACRRTESHYLTLGNHKEAMSFEQSAASVAADYNFTLPPPQVRIAQLRMKALNPD